MLYAFAFLLLLSKGCLGFQRISVKASNFRNHVQNLKESHTTLQLNLGLSDAFMLAEDVDLDALQKAIAGTGEDSIEVFVAKWIAIFFLSGVLLNRLKPQGSCRDDLIEVQPSFFLPSELGVVAKQLIPRGTVIGTYPGYLRSQRNMVDSKISEEAVKRSRKYQWAVMDNQYIIDPTGPSGALPKEIDYFFGVLKVGTSLACMNEPPPGLDVNVYVRIEGPKVEFIAERDIRPSEELFVDYGQTYNRNDYNNKDKKKTSPPNTPSDNDRIIDTRPVLEPIFDDGRSPPPTPTKKNKNKKMDDEWDNDNGIMSPSDALDLFNTGGASGLFTDPKDRDLVDSIMGKSSSGDASSSGKVGDEAMMEIMRRALMGGTGFDDNTPEEPVDSKTPKISIFDTRESTRDSSLTRGKGFASASSTVPPSAELAKEMEAKLDAMTDEEIEQMYAKIRSELTADGSLMKEKRLPRARPKNPEVAAKYADELQELQQLLEGMFDNPIETLRDMNMNPDKYRLDGEGGEPEQQQSSKDAENFGR